MALTIAGKGLAASRLFLATGLATSLTWVLVDMVFLGDGRFVAVHKPIIFGILAAHYNIGPFILLAALRASRDALPAEAKARAKGLVALSFGSALALDLTPAVYAVAPRAAKTAVAVSWVVLCILAGGLSAAKASHAISHGLRAGREHGRRLRASG